ncbi:MAG: ferritin-like domain-containing protein [Alphaproteobacteria bacterium]|nr:ferritin-like domain-containing protein [Alphaproteobacteria bacterium]
MNYVLPVDQTGWKIDGQGEANLRWDYDVGREGLLSLYDKGKAQQWDAKERIDWSIPLGEENPLGLSDEGIAIYGTPIWERMTAAERARTRKALQSWQTSQFLHGEQGALVCAAKIVQQVPMVDAKYYAATQVIDEARHVEAFARLLREKLGNAFPINPPLKALLNDVVGAKDWDYVYLGMQVLIEGLALAVFQRVRDQAENKLAASLHAYVMQDESRHVAFGRMALRDVYPQMTEAERAQREEFLIQGCYLMRDRFLGEEVWAYLGLPVKECMEASKRSDGMRAFRSRLFARIVPTVRDIGLWGPKVQTAFADMGVMEFASVDLEPLFQRDDARAREFDGQRQAS